MTAVLNLKKVTVAVFSVLAAGFVLLCSNSVRQGVINGLTLCGNSVIPSLFLFTAISLFAVNSGVLEGVNKISPLTKRLFGLNGNEFSVFALSMVAGYPVGAKMVNELLKSGQITKERVNRMLWFCVGAGPAFAVTVVGELTLGSKSDGERLLCATLFSSVVMAAVSRFVERKGDLAENKKEKAPEIPLSDAFVISVSGAAETMLKVSAFVVAFSGLLGAFNSLITSRVVQKYLFSLLEVTTGVQNFGRGELFAVAFLVGFGGISVQLQIMSAAGDIKPKFFSVFASRFVHGTLSAAFVLLFDWLFPRTVQTVALNSTGIAQIHGNPLSAVAMLLLAVSVVVFTYSASKTKKSPRINREDWGG